MNFMANRVMRHLLGQSYNMYTGFEDQLKLAQTDFVALGKGV